MAQKFKVLTKREKTKVRRKGRHSKIAKKRLKKQTLFTEGSCRG